MSDNKASYEERVRLAEQSASRFQDEPNEAERLRGAFARLIVRHEDQLELYSRILTENVCRLNEQKKQAARIKDLVDENKKLKQDAAERLLKPEIRKSVPKKKTRVPLEPLPATSSMCLRFIRPSNDPIIA